MKNLFPSTAFSRLLVTAALALPSALFAVNPPPDGGYSNQNTAEGENALFQLTSGASNTATGHQALFSNTTGDSNTATGKSALTFNSTGNNNTAVGRDALFASGTASSNTAVGAFSMVQTTIGDMNTAMGAFALNENSDGDANVAVGFEALFHNTGGNQNTAVGPQALRANTIGLRNTVVGNVALNLNTTGNNNTALGYAAGTELTTGSDNIAIGNAGVAGESGAIRIGTAGIQTATYIAGIRTSPLGSGVMVGIDVDGRLGVKPSSRRFKEAIQPMDEASAAIHALQPVTFRYKKALDPASGRQFGLLAEEVEKVNPDLIARDEQGKPYAVRYEAVNAMLLNEFLKEHRKVEEQARLNREQEATIARQQNAIEALTAAVKEQKAQIEKVSARIAAGEAAPRLVKEGGNR